MTQDTQVGGPDDGHEKYGEQAGGGIYSRCLNIMTRQMRNSMRY